MRYYYNDPDDLRLFKEIFGSAWEKAAALDRGIGAFLLLDEAGRAVLDENAAHCFGITEYPAPVHAEIKELADAAGTGSSGLAMSLLDTDKGMTAGFVTFAETDPLREIHYRLCTPRELADTAAHSPDAAIMMLSVEGADGVGEGFDSCVFSAAEAILSALPDNALMTRFSENEFRLCLPEGCRDPEGLARELAARVENCTIHNPLGSVISDKHSLRLAAGICAGHSAAAYKMHGAAIALYEARSGKGDSVITFVPERYESRRAEYESMMKFSRLISENLFVYHFQPIVSAATGKIYAYEALMRSDPTIGYGPLEILDIAEKRGRLYDIELATMRNSLAALSENQSFFDDRKLFINSLPSQLLTREDYKALVSDFGELMEKTVIEFTEHSEVTDEALKKMKERLAECGMQMAIDDYGTGYSNTGNLMRYSPDYVKLDRSLIAGIENDRKRQSLVSGLVEYLHSTGCMALAEGVETFEEVQTVINLSVDLLQGYYVSRPKPVLLNEISESVREEIVRINLEAQSRIQKIYRASDGETLELSVLALEKYTDIFIEGGRVTLAGESGTDRHVKLPVTVKENTECEIVLKNVCIEPEPDTPALILQQGSRVRLVCEGDNLFEKSMILVPEGAQLRISGTGSLSVNAETQDCYGIGNNHNAGFGDIIIDTDGNLNVIVNGENGVGIGGGKNGSVYAEAGRITVTVNSSNGVCIGTFDGKADIDLHDCGLYVTTAAATAVCIGSMRGNADIHLANIAAELTAQGNHLCAAGSLEGDLTLKANDMKFTTELRGRQIMNIGCGDGKHCECSVDRTEINLYSEGHTVTGIGGRESGGSLRIADTELNIAFLSGDSELICCPNGDVSLENIIKTVRLNE